MCVCECMRVCVRSTLACRVIRRMLGVLLCPSPPCLLETGSFTELGAGLAYGEPKTSSGLHLSQADGTELHLDTLSCLVTWMLGFELRSWYLCCKCLYLPNHLPTLTIIF